LETSVVAEKPLQWLGSARADLRRFPAAVRRVAGFQLRRVQQGLEPGDWKSMPTIGPGVREIRIHVDGAHRIFYVATFAEAVYVLHAFPKRTQRTAAGDLGIGRQRFRALVALRQRHEKKGRD
jgi:phage-related protein